MELRQLRYFVAIARARSFTGAARQLRVAQPALSQQLRALEEELGVVLIERSNRTGRLTEAGAHLLARAERILAEARDAGAEMAAHAGLEAGTVRIGCALQTLMEGRLPRLFADFHARHPGVAVLFREVHTEQVLRLVARGEVDLGLIHLGRLDGAAATRLPRRSDELVLLQLYREPLVVIVGPQHRLAARAQVALGELAEEPFVAFRPGAMVRELVAAAAQQHGFTPRRSFSTANLGTVRAFVAAGLGVAVVPASALDVPSPPLRGLRLSAPRLERVVTLVRNRARYESAAVAAVRRLVSTRLKGWR